MLNIGGFPMEAQDEKNKKIWNCINTHDFDVVGLTEINVHWKNISAANRLPERTLGWFEDLWLNTACCEDFATSSQSQVGGVSLWSLNKATTHIQGMGEDAKGLGRWAWTLFRGKAGIRVRVIAGHRPVSNETGPLSVWSQQRVCFLDHDDDRTSVHSTSKTTSANGWLTAIKLSWDWTSTATSAEETSQGRCERLVWQNLLQQPTDTTDLGLAMEAALLSMASSSQAHFEAANVATSQ